MTKQIKFKESDSVVVLKTGVKDPDLGTDIGGWQGRISEINKKDNLICIDWDSITLKNMPDFVIGKCEEEGLGWDQMYLEPTEVEKTAPRDTPRDVEKMIDILEKKHRYSSLGKEGKKIQSILSGVDVDNEQEIFKRWETYLKNELIFPFEAEVTEFQERGPFRCGDNVRVLKIIDVIDPYGILVRVKTKWRKYDFPLCDLKALDESSLNYELTDAYAVWFANR